MQTRRSILGDLGMLPNEILKIIFMYMTTPAFINLTLLCSKKRMISSPCFNELEDDIYMNINQLFCSVIHDARIQITGSKFDTDGGVGIHGSIFACGVDNIPNDDYIIDSPMLPFKTYSWKSDIGDLIDHEFFVFGNIRIRINFRDEIWAHPDQNRWVFRALNRGKTMSDMSDLIVHKIQHDFLNNTLNPNELCKHLVLPDI